MTAADVPYRWWMGPKRLTPAQLEYIQEGAAWLVGSTHGQRVHRRGRTHGHRGTYIDGCRCAACKTAERDYQRLRRQRARERNAGA